MLSCGKQYESICSTVSDQLLTKIIIPYEAKKIIIKELKICGITLKSIYPDAEHIAEEIKAFYNYGK